MAKYQALSLIWSYRTNREYQPGDMIDLEDNMARILFGKQCIQPAEYRRTEPILTGVDYDGTDDE